MLSALLALLAAAPAAAGISWTVSASSSATLGSELVAVYRASPAAGLRPDALAARTTDFAVVGAQARPDGSWAWTLLPLDVGRLAFTARWLGDGRAESSPPLFVSVIEPKLAADADIRDIKAPRAARGPWWPWLAGAALLAAAYGGWKLRRSRSAAGGTQAPPGPPPTPEQAAESAFAELAASGLWKRGEHAAYYLRLTAIVREYLESRWGEPATAMTSVEVARLIKSRGAPLSAAAAARELLGRADLVKFARLRAAPDEGPRDLETARGLIRDTTPKPAPPDPEDRA